MRSEGEHSGGREIKWAGNRSAALILIVTAAAASKAISCAFHISRHNELQDSHRKSAGRRLQVPSSISYCHCVRLRKQSGVISQPTTHVFEVRGIRRNRGFSQARKGRGCQTTLTLCGNLALQERNEAARADQREDGDEDGDV